jgi:membrane protease YdiL (CAAX protease family)
LPSNASEAVEILASALVVAAVAVPAGLVAAAFARRRCEPILPAARKRFSNWKGIDVAILAFFCLAFRDALAQSLEPFGLFSWIPSDPTVEETIRKQQLRYQQSTLVGVLSLPLLVWGFRLWQANARAEVRQSRIAGDVALGAGAFLILAPATFAVHIAVNMIFDALGMKPDDHPLKSMSVKTAWDAAFLFAGACVVAPAFEELGYRRILVPWAAKRLERCWIVLGFAGLVALAFSKADAKLGPGLFVLATAGVLGGLTVVAGLRPRWSPRPAAALVATAALFGAIHSSVWPTPIPLFVLGLGLGWLVLRTKTVLAAVVAHGLFNAISAVVLLRGAAG